MCRDQNLISETYVRTYRRTDVRMKIEKPVLGRPLLGPANIYLTKGESTLQLSYTSRSHRASYFGKIEVLGNMLICMAQIYKGLFLLIHFSSHSTYLYIAPWFPFWRKMNLYLDKNRFEVLFICLRQIFKKVLKNT